jgi:tetratricopeptide (TPR) repeat protein
MDQQHYEEAVSVLQGLVKSEPPNSDLFSGLGAALFAVKRYDEAADAVESAIKLAPDRANLYAQLGSAYLGAGIYEKSTAAYQKALEMDSRPVMYNNISYQMAEANKNLPLALTYAIKAVNEEEKASGAATLAHLKIEDLGYALRLAAYWDTLGWVHFRLGNLQEAEKYLQAAWQLSPGKAESDHLIQLYQKQHKSAVLPDSNTLRTTKLPRLTDGTANAEFFVILSRDSTTSNTKVDEVKFISGSEKLRSSSKALSAARFKFPFPDDGPSRLVRRGILGCYPYTGCSFVLFNPADVHSVN